MQDGQQFARDRGVVELIGRVALPVVRRAAGIGEAGGVQPAARNRLSSGLKVPLSRNSGALKFVGGRDKIAVPADASIDSAVGIGKILGGFGIAVELKISLPGVAPEVADRLIAEAHKVCPYSNATRGNIEVRLIRA
jgi:hypothetical protein